MGDGVGDVGGATEERIFERETFVGNMDMVVG